MMCINAIRELEINKNHQKWLSRDLSDIFAICVPRERLGEIGEIVESGQVVENKGNKVPEKTCVKSAREVSLNYRKGAVQSDVYNYSKSAGQEFTGWRNRYSGVQQDRI